MKKIILSFDDGPDPFWTPIILDILSTNNSKAVFFTVGKFAEAYSYIIEEIISEGHIIGNHTWSHKPFGFISRKNFYEEIESVHNFFTERFSYQIKLFRPPWGIIRNEDTKYIEQKFKYKSILWDINSKDFIWPFPISQKQISKNYSIILFHDGCILSPIKTREHTLRSIKILIRNAEIVLPDLNPCS